MKLAPFTSDKLGKSEIMCRLVGMVQTPAASLEQPGGVGVPEDRGSRALRRYPGDPLSSDQRLLMRNSARRFISWHSAVSGTAQAGRSLP